MGADHRSSGDRSADEGTAADDAGVADPETVETPNGVRTELAVRGLDACPVASVSAVHDGAVTGVSWTRAGGGHTEEFRVRDPGAIDRAAGIPEASSVIDLGDERVYRYARSTDVDCACSVIESLDVPITDARAPRTARCT